jgi:antitoxin component of MazEF toxin-antitoxin module
MREPMLYPAIGSYKNFAVSIQQIVEADPLEASWIGECGLPCFFGSDAAGRLNSMLCSPKFCSFLFRFERAVSNNACKVDGEGLDADTLRVYFGIMTKKLIRHGNSAALVLDKALLDLLKIQMDTPLEVTTDGRNVIISPQSVARAEATLLEALEKINRKHGSVLEKLAK